MFKLLINRCFNHLGYVKKNELIEHLNYARNIEKRLDEHRETVQSLENDGFFKDDYWWRAQHMATQDDYLMRIYFMVHGFYPDDKDKLQKSLKNQRKLGFTRDRPSILGSCELPEYSTSK